MLRVHQLWVALISSLWFVPLSMVLSAIGLAVTLVAVDTGIGVEWIDQRWLVFGVGAAGARGMLTAIAGSMITVASLTFSLTISTLAVASAQYTSRLIRNFMRDQLNQFVLGYFVGLFAYCLVVLRTIQSDGDDPFVPALAVFGGLLLALVSIGVLILFIHHIAESIQVGIILRRITFETIRSIENTFPNDFGASTAPAAGAPEVHGHDSLRWHKVSARRFGYVQSIDTQSLLARTCELDCVVRIVADIGSFVTPGATMCEVSLAEAPADEMISELRGTFAIGAARTIEQDVAFGIRQIVDIALRALSPGINDTTTGVMCVEHLAVVLESLAGKSIPDRFRAEDGEVRLIARGGSFDALTGLALDQIRQSASANGAVMAALLRAIEAAGRQTSATDRRWTLERHATLVGTLARDSIECPDDAAPVERDARRIVAELRSAYSSLRQT